MSSQSEISLASRLRDTSSDHIIEDDVVSSTSDEEDELEDEKHEEEVEDSTRYNNKWYCTFRGSIVPGRTRADPRWRSTWFEEWNRVFLLVSATGLFIDPLFFYALSISKTYMCVFVDGWFAITVTVLRCMTDAMHIWNIWIQFKAITAAQRSGHRRWCLKFGRRTLFDLFVILPLPQIVLWVVTPMLLKRGSTTMVMTMFLIIFVFQYLPKIYHSVCLLRRMQSVSGFVFGTIWWGFALNMIAYFVASHAAGACWFLLGLQRTTKCLIEQCHVMPGCTNKLLASQEPLFYGTTKMVHDNARLTWAANRSARSTCLDSFNNYEYGAYGWVIYLVANANRLEKVLLPIFWGLMTMSTFGNLAATAEWVESVFIIAILTSGLILVTMLIGNIKVFLHATTSKKQAMQLRMRNIEWWMSKRKLPPNMKQRVRNYEWQRWAAMRGVDECEMIKNLPEGLRRDIKYHLCLDLVRQVPLFQHMEDLVLENICDRVKSLIFTKGETITREGDPVRRMLFVVRGHLQSSQFLRDGVKSCCMLGPGNFSGDELLSWCLLKPGFLLEQDKDVGAVVVGFDRYFNYYKVQYGTLCIRENPGCLFIATNRDAVTHLTDAQEWAGGGSMVGALYGSTQREPLVVGKPSTFMMDYLSNKFGILKSQICMVGDRLDTDILFGQNGGCKTLLVLSGVTSLSRLQSPDNTIQPDFYTNKISDFLSLTTAAV